MALPIAATPELKGKDAEKFLLQLDQDLKQKVGLVPTPKIETARKLIKERAAKQKKQL
jgi:hypothetical protein